MRIIQNLIFWALAVTCAADFHSDLIAAVKAAQLTVFATSKQELGLASDKNIDSQKASADSWQAQVLGDLLAEVTKIMIGKYGPSVLPQLVAVDMNATINEANGVTGRKKRYGEEPQTLPCGVPPEDSDCNSPFNTNYRSISGFCNNKMNPTFGQSLTPIQRLLGTPSYQDGIGAIRSTSATGAALPSARQISNKIFQEGATVNFDSTTNHFHMQFGQFIAHDIVFMPSSVAANGAALDCSSCDSGSITPNCAPIPVPSDDPYFKPFGNGTARCMRLTRALNGQKGLGPRLQIDQNTHFLDLSTVYGSTPCESKNVRQFQNGLLKSFQPFNYVMPPQNFNDSNCLSSPQFPCFTCGDFRNSLHPGLIPLHSVYIKEHNRIATAFKMLRPDWTDETLFQETRRVVIAMYQHHVYNEYLPRLLGSSYLGKFLLTPLTVGFFQGYDQTVNPALPVECTAAAFRFGHSQARKEFPRGPSASTELGSNVFYADSQYQNGSGSGTPALLKGMLTSNAMAVDAQASFGIRNQLFEKRGQPGSGVDLIAVNIMRGRDAGVHPYLKYRSFVGLPPATTWTNILNEIPSASVAQLQSVYADVNDVDLYPAILMEKPVPGGMIGPTGAYIISHTFRELKRGDRFYYENQIAGSRGLTLAELTAIRKTSLAKVICSYHSDVSQINTNLFNVSSPTIDCGSLPTLDISQFALGIQNIGK